MAFGVSAPVCLIENDENGKLCVRKQAKDILDGIKDPVVVVSVVGLYRTGKSYLMNRLAGQQSGESSKLLKVSHVVVRPIDIHFYG